MEKRETMEKLLTYSHVDICYNGKMAAEDISFSLNKGEILGIVGESGSGKSTIIRAALGILGQGGMVTRGDIWFQDMDLPDLPEKEMRKIRGKRIGMIFQDAKASLCPIRTVGSQIRECLAAHGPVTRGEAEKRALELFERLGFPDGERILKSYPYQLSGGMNQRVGIAAAMLMNPDILLADEPTSALDVLVQKQVVEELLMLRKLYGTAMILVTHDLAVVEAMADRILVLKDGRMVEYGTVEEIFQEPREAYTRELLEAVPRLGRK